MPLGNTCMLTILLYTQLYSSELHLPANSWFTSELILNMILKKNPPPVAIARLRSWSDPTNALVYDWTLHFLSLRLSIIFRLRSSLEWSSCENVRLIRLMSFIKWPLGIFWTTLRFSICSSQLSVPLMWLSALIIVAFKNSWVDRMASLLVFYCFVSYYSGYHSLNPGSYLCNVTKCYCFYKIDSVLYLSSSSQLMRDMGCLINFIIIFKD